MTRRRLRVVPTLAVALSAAVLSAPALPGAALPAAAQVQAVVSYDAGLPADRALTGVTVVRDLPSVGAAVVRGDAPAVARLAGLPGVRGVALDRAVHLTGRAGGPAGGVLAGEQLARPGGSPHAGRGVRVAVVDTGVSDTEALSRGAGGRGRLLDGVDTSRLDDVRTSGRFTDGHGHGTFLASLVAGGPVRATRGRPLGVAPGATVVVVKVAGPDGRTSLGSVVAGLAWIAAHPRSVDVAALALSVDRPGAGYGNDPLVDAVHRVREAGVPVVVSSGNRADRVGDPGFDPRGLTVGAADVTDGQVAAFSGSGVVAGVRRPDLVASGVGVLGLVPRGSVIDRTAPRRADGLVRGSGTSQATAVVAGAAAVLLAEHPRATPAQVKGSLVAAARDLPGGRDGAGLLRLTETLQPGTGPAAPGPGSDAAPDLARRDVGWDAGSWGAGSWGAGSWGAGSWGAGSWGAGSWGAASWGAASWGPDGTGSP